MDILENLRYYPELVRVQTSFNIDKVSFDQTMKRFREVFGNYRKTEYKFNTFTNRITIYYSFVVDNSKIEQTITSLRNILGDSFDFKCFTIQS